MRVLTEVFTRTYYNEYDVLISVSARTYKSHLTKTRISHARIYPNEPWIGYVLAWLSVTYESPQSANHHAEKNRQIYTNDNFPHIPLAYLKYSV